MTAPAAPAARPRRRKPAGLYAPLDWLLVRAPLLPVDAYARLDDPTLLEDARVRAALAVGAGDLADAVERGRLDARARTKLQRYLIRMSTRPTPYGLFAGVALGRPGPVTDLALAADAPRARARPDMAWLLGLVAALEERPEVRRALRFTASTAAWVHAGRVFLHAGSPVSVRATGPVLRALELARTPRRGTELIDELSAAHGAPPEKAQQLIDELWRQGLLVSELRPPLTHPSPAAYVAERLAGVPEGAALGALLDALDDWDASSAAGYRALAERAEAIHASGDEPPLQVDAALALSGTGVATAVADEAARAAELLVRLGGAGAAFALHSYRGAFAERYGTEREVPLLELLDRDAGLGPPGGHGWGADTDPERSARRDRLLWELAVEAVRDRRREIELDDAALDALTVRDLDAGALPRTLDLAVFVLAGEPEQIDGGDFRLLIGPNLGAQAAGRNLGRFADLLGAEGRDAMRAAALADEGRGRLSAELVYLPPRERSANVAIRPLVREYEIAVGTNASAAPERVIPLDELVVGIRGDRFYVRWPRADADVTACAGHMLNSMHAPDVCRFLEDVARDGRVHLSSFDWGAAARLPYLPRVRAGRSILEPARWRIDLAARDRELPCEDAAGFAAALARWREAWEVPRRVYLTAGDNRLLIDLDDPVQAEQLRAELRGLQGAGAVVLQEGLPDPETAWMPGPGGRYLTEFVFPLALREPAGDGDEAAAAAPAAAAVPRPVRLRPPGSDWLFLKLYCARAAEEDLIAGPVRSLGEFALAAGLADDWFFLRYSDPEPHLRVRFRGEPQRLLARLLPEVCARCAELVDDGVCRRFALDTYEREVERYGGERTAALAEAIFGADSRAVADLLDLARGLELDRTELAALTIDDLLGALGLDASARLDWYRDVVAVRHESGDEYRRRSDALRRVLGAPAGEPALRQVLAARRAAIAPLAARLDAAERPRTELCRSFVHLHCNRLLGPGPPHEARLLGLLLRTREGLDRAPLRA